MRKLILLVDDENEVLLIIKSLLERKGYDVVTAADGKEAVAIALEKMPDLIMMDVIMPNMDGREAVKVLKDDRFAKRIPVIFLSATVYNSSGGKVSESIDVDGEIFPTIAKPFELEEILGKVNQLIENTA